MKNDSEDIVYRCKDCDKYNLCDYYHGRKETSQICHYFELPKRKTGKWEEKYMTEEEWIRGAPSTVCPFCQKVNRNGKTPYCPHCGEKVEVDE